MEGKGSLLRQNSISLPEDLINLGESEPFSLLAGQIRQNIYIETCVKKPPLRLI